MSHAEEQPKEPIPNYRLYTPEQVSGATFLGSAIAGAILMRSNYARLGQQSKATISLVVGVLVTAVVIVLAMLLPENTGYGIPLIITVIYFSVAKKDLGDLVASHLQAGGERESGWKTAGIGLACMVLVLGIIVGLIIATESDPLVTQMDFGQSQHVYYRDNATEEDARNLGNYLKESGFFNDAGPKDVLLRREDGKFNLSFVTIEDFWDNPEIISGFEELGRRVSSGVFEGQPVTIHLIDSNLEVHRTLSPLSSAP